MVKKLCTVITLAIALTTISTSAFADYYSENVKLQYGTTSANVTDLQKDLKNLGYFNYTASGYFGDTTNIAVKNFQRDNNLLTDGIVGHQTAREIKVEEVLKLAKSYQGVPYVWGGTTPSGFDCSGFTQYVLSKNSISMQRTAAAQYTQGAWVQKSALVQGDLVFFSTYKAGASHVGIYLGNNQFVHASSGAGRVTISDLSKTYYAQHYIGAKRFIW